MTTGRINQVTTFHTYTLLDHWTWRSHAWEFVKTSIDVYSFKLSDSLFKHSAHVHTSIHKADKRTTMGLVSHILDQLILVMIDKTERSTSETINNQLQYC
jgi:hypothetical protein